MSLAQNNMTSGANSWITPHFRCDGPPVLLAQFQQVLLFYDIDARCWRRSAPKRLTLLLGAADDFSHEAGRN